MGKQEKIVRTGAVEEPMADAAVGAGCVLIGRLVQRLGLEMVGLLTLQDHSAVTERVLAHGARCAECAEVLSAGQDLWMKNHPDDAPPADAIEAVRTAVEAHIQSSRYRLDS